MYISWKNSFTSTTYPLSFFYASKFYFPVADWPNVYCSNNNNSACC